MNKAMLISPGMPQEQNLVIIWDFSNFTTYEQLSVINMETKDKNLYFDYSHQGGGDLLPEVLNELVIGFQLIQGLGTNFIYDLMKSSILRIFNIIPRTKKPDIYVRYLGEEISLEFNFDLTDEQKDKIVDAGVNILLEKTLHK